MANEARVVEEGAGSSSGDTFYSVLAARAAAEPDRPYLHDGTRSRSYRELLSEVDALAAGLAGRGIGRGDRVVLWLPNGVEWAVAFFACARLGAAAVMAGTRLRAPELRHILVDSAARTLIWKPRFLSFDYDAMVENAIRDGHGRPLANVRDLLSVGASEVPGAVQIDRLAAGELGEPLADPDEVAVICYTSGTTDQPKGCLHSHRTLVRNGTVAARLTGIGQRDRVLCPVPFAHVFGFHMGVLQTALSGATLVNGEPYGAERLLDLAESEGATILYMVPAMAREVLAAQGRNPRQLDRLRVCLLAGAPVSAKLREAVADPGAGLGSKLSIVYGCTEAPTLTQLDPGAPPSRRLRSVGRATPGVELKICRRGSSQELPAGETGEILARGYNRMLGYLDDDEATARKLRDGWLATGDLGWLDEEGYLQFVGRADEMFVVGGFNAYPREIETRLEEMPGVAEVAVTGVPDRRLGQVPMAWATVEDPGLDEEQIIEWTRDRIASYRRPRYCRIVGSLPRTASGKLSRVKLQWLARRALPGLDWDGEG
ncbi:MAG TPA: class I adenylate-forming enzyme family protein [Solirubrobacterales bacterium]